MATEPEVFTFSPDDFAEDEEEEKEVWTIYGEKGTGKTTFACGFRGSKGIISYDRKTKRIKERMYLGDKDIHVYDGAKFYRAVPKEDMPKAGSRSFAYIVELLNRLPEVDWVVHDGLEGLIEISEMKMRHDNNITAFGGVDFSIWKDRKANLRLVHGLSLARAKKGIMYVTYADEDKLIEDGRLIRQSKAPKWVDIVMSETDNVVRVEMRPGREGELRFVALMQTIKVGPWKNGQVLDVTGRTIADATVDIEKKKEADEEALTKLFQ
jgi:hypothetical protein